MLKKTGMGEEALSPLRKPKIRFKFYLEYATKAPKYDPGGSSTIPPTSDPSIEKDLRGNLRLCLHI